MELLTRIRTSLRLRKPAPAAATVRFADPNAVTVELEVQATPPARISLPPVSANMISIAPYSPRLHALRYESEFYSSLR